MAVSAASAEEAHAVNSGTEVNLASDGKEYIVSPWTESFLSNGNPICAPMSTQYISQGQTINHYASIGSGVNWLEADLNWEDTSDSLSLTIYTPSGSNLGTFYDNYDESINGRIHINIYPSQGYIKQGSWRFKVYGESVSGTQRYTLTIYQH